MPDVTDQTYLLSEQYRDASNLNARIRLHQLYSVRPRSLHGWIFDRLLEIGDRATILEIGCGTGTLWSSNTDRIPEDWVITLTDLSPGMVEEADRNLAGCMRNFSFRQMDAQDIPFEDETFDVVIANYMLYHVPDRPRAIMEMARVLRPGGRLYTATPGLGHMRELDELVQGFKPNAGRISGQIVSGFALDNGGEQLEGAFKQVELLRFEEGPEDGLAVTEAEPLVDYIMSMMSYAEVLSEGDRPRLTAYIQAILARDGVIRINKESGMFVAIRGAV